MLRVSKTSIICHVEHGETSGSNEILHYVQDDSWGCFTLIL
jgi:hypothetical protein